MASGVIDTSLAVNLGDSSSGGTNTVYIKIHQGFFSLKVYAQLEIYPIAPDLVIKTSNGGRVIKASGFTQVVTKKNEYINLGGGTSFTATLPIDQIVGIDKNNGFFLDNKGNSINPSFSYNPATKTIESNMEVIGYLPITYNHVFGLYDYYPKPAQKQANGGYLLELDTIFAFYKGSYSYLQIEPNPVPDLIKIEVLTLWSNMLVSERGSVDPTTTGDEIRSAFEKPQGWDSDPKDGSYPGGSSFVLPTETQVYEQKRDHAKWYFTGNHFYLKEEHTIFPLEYPYNDHYNWVEGEIVCPSGVLYNPAYTLDMANLESITNSELLNTNKTQIINLVNDKFVQIANKLGLTIT